MAIGNPFGLDHTLTAGIISGVGREVKSPIGRPITNVIQVRLMNEISALRTRFLILSIIFSAQTDASIVSTLYLCYL
jgi:S1-C subfamily serine protease